MGEPCRSGHEPLFLVTDPCSTTMANVTPAIKRIMTKGEWRFDGTGYLASHRFQSNGSRVAQEVRNGYALWNRAGL